MLCLAFFEYGLSQKKETGQRSQMAFSSRKSDGKDHRGVFPDRLPCLILFGVITGPPEVGQSL